MTGANNIVICPGKLRVERSMRKAATIHHARHCNGSLQLVGVCKLGWGEREERGKGFTGEGRSPGERRRIGERE